MTMSRCRLAPSFGGAKSWSWALLLAAVVALPAAGQQIDDFTQHTFSVPFVGIDNFADLPISRTFEQEIQEIQVTIEAGTADDVGFVGALQVTDGPLGCSGVQSVVGSVDVTSQITVDGATASLVLRALENCCCATGWGSATEAGRTDALLHWVVSLGEPEIEIELDPPPPGDRYVIDASPAMPEITAVARVVGASPDPTPETTFTWTASLAIDRRDPASEVLFDDDLEQNLTTLGEDPYALTLIDPSEIRGGRLGLTATATVDDMELTGELPPGVTVEGTNPQRSAIQSSIDQQTPGNGFSRLEAADLRDALKRIACQESGQHQFSAAAGGGIGFPCISSDDGIGIFQITRTDRCADPFVSCRQVIFDWRENVAEGVRTLQDKSGPARRYPNFLKRTQAYRDHLRDVINPQREAAGLRPIHGFPAPSFTHDGAVGAEPPNQLLEDTVRGFNGFAGQLFGVALHEFAPDLDFLTTLPDDQLQGLNRNPDFWRRVPAAERPQNTGDPDYVMRVIGRDPTCPTSSACT
jgi:hypothetical protein